MKRLVTTMILMVGCTGFFQFPYNNTNDFESSSPYSIYSRQDIFKLKDRNSSSIGIAACFEGLIIYAKCF